jgi:hypothetical protein
VRSAPIAKGTGSSNPASSSGESGANFASSDKVDVTLGNPTLTSELKERLAAGITAETAGRGIAELAPWQLEVGSARRGGARLLV